VTLAVLASCWHLFCKILIGIQTLSAWQERSIAMSKIPAIRKRLSADALFRNIQQDFQKIPDPRTGNSPIRLVDTLMSGLAMFALKDPSLLAFDQRRQKDEKNLQMIFHMQDVPADTTMRETLDPFDYEQLRPAFRHIFACLQRDGALPKLRFLNGYYLLALDGTEYFSSHQIHCLQCCEKHHADGTVTYHHQLLGAAIVCPGHKEVIPLMPEPIFKQDGETKNDCERNALKRFLPKFRLDHPHLRVIVTLDALYANAPVIHDLRKSFVEWIIRVKQDGNKFLFKQVEQLAQGGLTEEFKVLGEDGVLRYFQLAYNVPLNESNTDVRVDFLDMREPTGEDDKWRHFTFILEPLLRLCRPQAELWMQGGRARWKVENETFNTLKNQGYHLAHNFGHGYRNLSVVLVMLMMLAFLVDQTQQLGCRLFAAAWEKCISKRALWEQLREIFHQFHVSSLKAIYESVLSDRKPRLKALWDP
jgi:hypothetical protein